MARHLHLLNAGGFMSISGGEVVPIKGAGGVVPATQSSEEKNIPNYQVLEIPRGNGKSEEFLVLLIPTRDNLVQSAMKESYDFLKTGGSAFALATQKQYRGEGYDVLTLKSDAKKLAQRLKPLDLNKLTIKSTSDINNPKLDEIAKGLENYIWTMAAMEPVTPEQIEKARVELVKNTTVQYATKHFGPFEGIKNTILSFLSASPEEKPEAPLTEEMLGRFQFPGTAKLENLERKDPLSTEVASVITVQLDDEIGIRFLEEKGLMYVGAHRGKSVYTLPAWVDHVSTFIEIPMAGKASKD